MTNKQLTRIEQDDLIDSVKEAVSRSCTPEWNQVCKALAELYEIYCKKIKDIDMVDVFEAVDKLMAAYDEWLD